MLAISNAELSRAAPLGVKVDCPKCGKLHRVKAAMSKKLTEINYVVCRGKVYFVGIDGVKV